MVSRQLDGLSRNLSPGLAKALSGQLEGIARQLSDSTDAFRCGVEQLSQCTRTLSEMVRRLENAA